jgi:serine/threonine protein kinase
LDATREHLLGRLLLERRVLAEEELRRFVGERDDLVRRGGRVTLAQLLVRERRIDPGTYASMQGEIELRGRACFACRRAYLVAAGGPAVCPACGGPALLPAMAQAPAAAQPQTTPGSGFLQGGPGPASSAWSPPSDEPYSASGRFPARPGGLAGNPSPSGRFPMPNLPPAQPAFGQYPTPHNGNGGAPNGMAPGFGQFPGAPPQNPMSGRFQYGTQPGMASSARPGNGVMGSMASHATPYAVATTDPGTPGAPSARQGAELGKALGPYDLLEELGRGGMGVVYKARHREQNIMVALKVLLSGEFASPKMLARFKEEAHTVQKLDHPNVVPVFDVGEIEGVHYFTMKFVEGDLFQGLLKGKGLAARRGAEILRDVARGAHHAHEHGIVHRDLKPANVIVERETGVPFIMDFGLAKDLEEDKGLSKSGVAIGTPYYMPPEQAQGKHREIDRRSDVYALGAMLYEVLARRVPFNAESQTILLRKIVEEDPVPPSKIRQGVPADLETIALKAIRKRKEDRYASAEEFAKDLERALAGKKILGKREPAISKLIRKLKKNPRVLGIVALSIVICLGGIGLGAYFYQKQKKDKADADAAAAAAALDAKKVANREATETNITKGHGKRLEARTANNAKAARVLLGEAADNFSHAVDTAEEEAQARAQYERGLCKRDLGDSLNLNAAIADLKAAAASKALAARANLALGVIALRREHDDPKARAAFEAAQTPGDTGEDSGARLDEETAALLARGYLAQMNRGLTEGMKLFREANLKGGDLAVDVSEALGYAGLASAVFAGHQLASQAEKDFEQGLNRDHWRYTLLVGRAWARAILGNPKARDDANYAHDACPEAKDVKVAEAWMAARDGSSSDALAKLREARADRPAAGAYWDSLEAKLKEFMGGPKPPPPPGQDPTRRDDPPRRDDPRRDDPSKTPTPAPSRTLWSDLRFDTAKGLEAKIAQVHQALAADKRDDALALLKKLEDEDKTHSGFRIWRAKILYEMDRFDDARSLLEPILVSTPEDLFALTVMALVEGGANHADRARELWDRCVKLADKSATPLRTPRFLYATWLMNQKQFEDAKTAIRPVFRNDETDVEAGIMLATALQYAGHPEEGLSVASGLANDNPRDLNVRFAYSAALRNTGKLADSLKYVDEGLAIFPGVALLSLDRGVTLWLLARYDDAEVAWKTASQNARTDDERNTVKGVVEQVKAVAPRK